LAENDLLRVLKENLNESLHNIKFKNENISNELLITNIEYLDAKLDDLLVLKKNIETLIDDGCGIKLLSSKFGEYFKHNHRGLYKSLKKEIRYKLDKQYSKILGDMNYKIDIIRRRCGIL